MKKKIFSIMMAGLALVALGSCSNTDYTEKYPDPSKTNTVSVPDVFTAVLFKGNTWLNPVYYRYYCQTQTSGVFGGMIGSSNGKDVLWAVVKAASTTDGLTSMIC